MANRKKEFKDIPPKKLREVWDKVTPADWLALLQEHKPDNNWTLSGKTIKGCCPYHDERNPSFVISLDKRQAKCFGACDKYIWNPIQFYADIASSSYSHALQDLRKRFNLRISAAYAQNAQKVEDNDRLKKALFQAMHLELTGALSQDTKPEYQYLHKSNFFQWIRNRKLPEETAHKWPVGVMPTRQRLMARLDEIGSGDLKSSASSYLGTYLGGPSGDGCEGWIAFFYYTSPTTIGRIKLRKPKDGKDVPYYFIDDHYVEGFGWFGLNTFSHLRGKLQNHPLHVLEGEMDVLALVAHQEAEGCDDIFSIATSGKGEYDVMPAFEFGFNHIRAIPDNDKSGQSWAVAVMNDNERVDRVFRWMDPQVKDPDEAFRAWGFEITYDRLTDSTNYPRNYEWCSEQLEQDLLNTDSADVRRRNELAARYGQALHDDSERAAFLGEAVQQEGIDKELVIQDMSISEDSPEAFLKRIELNLGQKYEFIGRGQAGTAATALVWDKVNRVTRTIKLESKQSIVATVQLEIGDLITYIKTNFGEPDFLNFRIGPKGMPIRRSLKVKIDQIEVLIVQAIRNLASKAPLMERLVKHGPGVHFINEFGPEKLATVFVVNGQQLFKGQIAGNLTHWEELAQPIHDSHYFDLEKKPWSQFITSVKEIESGAGYNLKELFQKLFRIFNLGWNFTFQENTAKFLAADVLYTTVAAVFGRYVLVEVSGDTNSGKTMLLQVYGGKQLPDVRLCEATEYIEDYTAAGIRQIMDGVQKRVLLDEFENSDSNILSDRKAKAVRDILDMLRSASSGASSVRGTPSGAYQEFRLTVSATVAGIRAIFEPRDENRYISIETKKKGGHPNPPDIIEGLFTHAELENIRRAVTLALLPRLQALRVEYKKLRQQLSKKENLPQQVDTRLKDNLLPAATILNLADEDGVEFLKEFSTQQIRKRKRFGTPDSTTEIWDAILHTQIPPSFFCNQIDRDTGANKSIGQFISSTNSNDVWLLHKLDLGVYLFEKSDRKNYLVIFWPKAMTGILALSPKYRGRQKVGWLKREAANHPHVIPDDKVTKKLINMVADHVGTPVTKANITVLEANKVINSIKPSTIERTTDILFSYYGEYPVMPVMEVAFNDDAVHSDICNHYNNQYITDN